MRLLSVGLLIVLFALSASAQVAGSGTIEGTVTDASGGVIANATVTAANTETGVLTTRITNSTGFFVLSPLQPGVYTVTVTASGFRTLTQQRITVAALATVGFSPSLQVGTATEVVTV